MVIFSTTGIKCINIFLMITDDNSVKKSCENIVIFHQQKSLICVTIKTMNTADKFKKIKKTTEITN